MLGRALDRESLDPSPTAMQRAYLRVHAMLPTAVSKHLPQPWKIRDTPARILNMLSRLGTNAYPVEPSIARAMRVQWASVSHIAIGCYCDDGLLKVMTPAEKAARLPDFIRCLSSNDSGVRNNAAVAVREFPAQAGMVVPALTNILSEPQPHARAMICQSLAQLDREAAVRAGVVSIAIQILKHPDNQVAYCGAEILGTLAAQPELSVPALIAATEAGDDLVGVSSIDALGRFTNQTHLVLPALTNALKSTHSGMRLRAQAMIQEISKPR